MFLKTSKYRLIIAIILSLFIAESALSGRIKLIYSALKTLKKAASEQFSKVPVSYKHIKSSSKETMADYKEDQIKGALKKAYKTSSSKVIKQQLSKSTKKYTTKKLLEYSALTISPSVANSSIKILNIKPKYKDGIKLKPANYQISIEKDGYRSQRFNIDFKQEKEYEIEMHKKGLEQEWCESAIEVKSNGSGFSASGQIYQIKLSIEHAYVPEIYLSFAEMQTGHDHFERVLATELSQDYAYFKLIQPSALSKEDIENNHNVVIDPKRNIQSTVGFEQQGDSVLLIWQAKFPQGVFLASDFKGFICNEFKNL